MERNRTSSVQGERQENFYVQNFRRLGRAFALSLFAGSNASGSPERRLRTRNSTVGMRGDCSQEYSAETERPGIGPPDIRRMPQERDALDPDSRASKAGGVSYFHARQRQEQLWRLHWRAVLGGAHQEWQDNPQNIPASGRADTLLIVFSTY